MGSMRHLLSKTPRYRLRPGLIAIHLVLILVGSTMIVPFLWMVSTSLKPRPEIERYPPTWVPHEPTVNNYVEAFRVAPFHVFFINSVIVSFAVTASILFFCSLGGYVFAKLKFPGRDVAFLLVLGKIMVPFQLTIIPLYLIITEIGLANSLGALIVPLMIGAFGIFMMRQFIIDIPDDLMDAAFIDGCGAFGIYWRIILPSVVPALATLAIFTFIDTWGQFLWPLIVIKSIDKMTLQIGLALFSNEYFTDYGPLMAATLVSVMPLLIVFAILQRRVIESITLTGLKS